MKKVVIVWTVAMLGCSFFILKASPVIQSDSEEKQKEKVFVALDTVLAQEYYEKGEIFREQYLLDSAIRYFAQSADIYRKARQWDRYTQAQTQLSDSYLYNNAIDSAGAVLREVRRQLPDVFKEKPQVTIMLMDARVGIYVRLRHLDSAISLANEALQLKKSFYQNVDHPSLAKAYQHMAISYATLEDFPTAVTYFDSAILVAKKVHGLSSMELSKLYYNKAAVLRWMERYAEALEYNFMSLAIEKEHKAGSDLSMALTDLAVSKVYLDRNQDAQDNFQARDYLDRSMKILQKIDPEHSHLIYWYYGYGRLYYNLKAYTQAIEYFEKAIEMNVKNYGEGYKELVYPYQMLALIYMEMGEYELAEKMLDKTSEFHTVTRRLYDNDTINGTPKGYILRGDLEARRNKINKAAAYYHRAIMVIIPGFSTNNLLDNPEIDSVGIDEELLEALVKKADMLRQLSEEEDDATAYLNASLNTYGKAIRYVDLSRQGMHTLDTKLEYNRRTVDILDEALGVAVTLYRQQRNPGLLDTIFRIMEGKKSNLMHDELKHVQAKLFGDIPAKVLAKERSLKANISFIQKQLFERDNESGGENNSYQDLSSKLFHLKRELEVLSQDLETNYPAYYHLKYETRPLSLLQMQAMLDEDQLLLEFFAGDTAIYVLAATAEDAHVFMTTKEASFNTQVHQLLQALKEKEYTGYTQNAYALYQKLLAPALSAFEKKEHLLIVADGILGYLPFEILLTARAPAQKNYRHLPYLLNDHIVSYHYSANLLAFFQSKRKTEAQERFIGFAPVYNKKNTPLLVSRTATDRELVAALEALPGAEKEVRTLAAMMDGVYRTGETATEANFKAQARNFSIVHLASHAIINDQNPMYSKLVFSPETDTVEDGLLHTYELYNMQLGTEMVCLSACNTGVGEIYEGEGIMSLARGFMYAGVPNILMSLWAVPDISTAQLMQYFYEALQAGNSRPEAVRRAKLRYLQEADLNTAHPYYWSAFVLIGDPAPADESLLSTGIILASTVFLLLLIATLLKFRR